MSNGVWVVTEDLKFVSDPMLFGRHIVELNATNNALVRSYVWGLDLSETMDGAGGVGGLLWVNQHSGPSAGAHFCAYDGNGNIVALIAAADGAETTRYEYGPFGEPIRVSGPLANSNPFRFSTKRTDNTTDLVLYEYRAYSPSTGRWPNRDPIGERGGENLYGFVENAPVNKTDLLGRETVGAAYQSDGGLGHAALEVGGKGSALKNSGSFSRSERRAVGRPPQSPERCGISASEKRGSSRISLEENAAMRRLRE